MARPEVAVVMVIDYILSAGLYSFKSLAEETQAKLIEAYGKDFENKVNAQLALD
jgi:hypothetical protein